MQRILKAKTKREQGWPNLDKIDFNIKTVKRDKRQKKKKTNIIIKGSIQQEDITILCVYEKYIYIYLKHQSTQIYEANISRTKGRNSNNNSRRF